jgi:hypothetical protein
MGRSCVYGKRDALSMEVEWLEQKTTYIVTIHCEKETLVVNTEI